MDKCNGINFRNNYEQISFQAKQKRIYFQENELKKICEQSMCVNSTVKLKCNCTLKKKEGEN